MTERENNMIKQK